MPEGLRVRRGRGAQASASTLAFTHFDWSCDYYAKHGRMMPEDWLEQLSRLRRDLLRRGRLAGDACPTTCRCGAR